jgi:HAD superfamily hydrolase (TIGR01490 family)
MYNARVLGIAFFDLDLTLLSINSGSAWVVRELRDGRLTLLEVARAMYYLGLYRMGRARMEDALVHAISTLKGKTVVEVRQNLESFYERYVRNAYRPGGLKALEEHKQRGDVTALLSSTSMYLAEAVARDLALDATFCNRFEVDGAGALTGRSQGGLCYGPGKLDYAQAFAQSRGLSLDECVFYTDSISDLPVLERVGRPVVVNPDGRLKREAVRRKWEVVDWGKPRPSR